MANNLPKMTARNFTLFQPVGSFDLSDPESCDSFKKSIAGQIQGEIALFQENWPIETAALAFAVAYNLSDEALLRLSTGKIVRIFKHSDEPVSYTEKIDSSLAQKLAKLIGNSSFISEAANIQSSFSVDLAKLWNQAKGANMMQRAVSFADSLSPILRPAETIILIGQAPILPLFVAIILARPCGHQIIYQAKASAAPIRLF